MTTLKSRFVPATVVCLLLASAPAGALITGEKGNSPVHDRNWRAGAIDVANLKCRVARWERPPFGGGQSSVLYRGDTDTFNTALEAFAKVRAPSLELIVCDGPGESFFLANGTNPDGSYDWDFVIWDVQSYYRLHSDPTSALRPVLPDFGRPLPPPRMTVYIGGGGAVEWDNVRVPEGIAVIDRRGSAAGIKPGQGAVIAGTVYDMATAKPLADATITVGRMKENREYETVVTGQSDAAGRFRMAKVPPGKYRVSVAAEGYASLVAGRERLVADGYLAFDDVELARLASVTGSVANGAGKPIAGGEVLLNDTLGMNGQSYRLVEPARTTTDVEGRFTITGVPTGYGRVVCRAEGYYTPLTQLRPVPADDAAVIHMRETGAIKGTVTGGARSAGYVHVSSPEGEKVGTWGGSTQVKPDGTFQFDNVPPGTYVISTEHLLPGETPDANAKRIKVVARQTVTVELGQ